LIEYDFTAFLTPITNWDESPLALFISASDIEPIYLPITVGSALLLNGSSTTSDRFPPSRVHMPFPSTFRTRLLILHNLVYTVLKKKVCVYTVDFEKSAIVITSKRVSTD
ncbi:MAG: hypothetical protein ACE5H4_11250, partial [Candidatus Thorarchaeota archaeon]